MPQHRSNSKGRGGSFCGGRDPLYGETRPSSGRPASSLRERGLSFDSWDSDYVTPKKALGQHFLSDQGVAMNIVAALQHKGHVLEVGPGMGVLTQYLLPKEDVELKVVEIDTESVRYLLEHFPAISQGLYEADFLKQDLSKLFDGEFAVIGNFPYNISSQIFFKVLDYRDSIPEVVCMVQKEVAERIAEPPGSKTYGILSVLLQAWYDIEYLFTVGEGAFVPPPKVKSAVIRLTRNNRIDLGCDEALMKNVVKSTFGMRRKTIRNSIRPLCSSHHIESGMEMLPFLNSRPEQLSVEDFITLTNAVAELRNITDTSADTSAENSADFSAGTSVNTCIGK